MPGAGCKVTASTSETFSTRGKSAQASLRRAAATASLTAGLGRDLEERAQRLAQAQRLAVIHRTEPRASIKQATGASSPSSCGGRRQLVARRVRRALLHEAAQVEGVHELVEERELFGNGVFLGQSHRTLYAALCRLTVKHHLSYFAGVCKGGRIGAMRRLPGRRREGAGK